jgi:hypothetical protein
VHKYAVDHRQVEPTFPESLTNARLSYRCCPAIITGGPQEGVLAFLVLLARQLVSMHIAENLVQAWYELYSCKHSGAVLPSLSSPVGCGVNGINAMTMTTQSA